MLCTITQGRTKKNALMYTKSVKCPTSAVTKASTRTSKKRYQKDMEGKKDNNSSKKSWYFKYQGYIAINNIYKRVTKASTHEAPK